MQPTLFDMGDSGGGSVQLTARKAPVHYYRCPTCCDVFTVPGEFPNRFNVQCSCEGMGLDYLGQSKGMTTSRLEERCACDARCTHAMGPKCDCSCCGANHGTGKTVTVEIVGSIPRVRLSDPAAAKARRLQYETECTNVELRLAGKYPVDFADYRAGNRISNSSVWREIYYTLAAVRATKRLKVHANRIAALKKLCP